MPLQSPRKVTDAFKLLPGTKTPGKVSVLTFEVESPLWVLSQNPFLYKKLSSNFVNCCNRTFTVKGNILRFFFKNKKLKNFTFLTRVHRRAAHSSVSLASD